MYVSLYISQFPQFSPNEDFVFHPHTPYHKWNSSLAPNIFTHDTDVHINVLNEGTKTAFRTNLLTADIYHPQIHFLTGDLSDNYKIIDDPRYSEQVESEWQGYYEVLNTTNYTYEIIECAGNHDMTDISSKNSKNFYLLEYTKTYYKNELDNDLKKYPFSDIFVINENGEKYGGHPIVVLNPFRFPTGHANILFYPEPQISFLDKLEEVIFYHNLTHMIVICHFPPDMWRKIKSTNGKRTIRDIMASKDIDIILTGHTHPSYPKIRHHGQQTGILEITGVGGMEHDIIGLLTEDNNRFVYHPIHVKNPPKAIITHPVPSNQTNYHTAYAEEGTEIRVLYPGPNANIKVTGDCECEKMEMKMKVNEDFYLYSCPLKITTFDMKNVYQINFEGDFIDSLDFVYGNTTFEVRKETERNSPHNIYCEIYFTLALFIIFQVILFPFSKKMLSFPKLERWIEGKVIKNEVSCSSTFWNILVTFFFGFLAVRTRILNTPFYVRFTLYLAATWPIALPLTLMYVGDVLGFIFSYGYVAKNYVYSTQGPSYTLLFFKYYIAPFMIIISAISTKKFWHFAMFFDVCMGLAILAYGFYYVVYITLPSNVGFVLNWISFAFTWIPLILLTVVIIWLVKMYKHKDDPNHQFSTVPLIAE